MANRLAVRLGATAAVSVPDTPLGPHPTLTGNPVRPEIAAVQRQPGSPALVGVVGASLGAAVLNDAVLGVYDRWRNRSDLAIRLVTGPDKFAAVEARFRALRRPDDRLDCTVIPYEHDMAGLYRDATVMVTRGGGSIFELAAAGMPAVIVPWAGATEGHQTANARAAERAGAAVHLAESACTP